MGSGFVVLWLVFLIIFRYMLAGCSSVNCSAIGLSANRILQDSFQILILGVIIQTRHHQCIPDIFCALCQQFLVEIISVMLNKNVINITTVRVFPSRKGCTRQIFGNLCAISFAKSSFDKEIHSTWWISSQAHFKSCGISSALLYHTLVLQEQALFL